MVALVDGGGNAVGRLPVSRRDSSDEADGEPSDEVGRSDGAVGATGAVDRRGRTELSNRLEGRLRSPSPGVEFLPEDREWLAEVLLKPLGSVQLTGLQQPEPLQGLQRPLAPAVVEDVQSFLGHLLPSNESKADATGTIDDAKQLITTASLHVALQDAVTATSEPTSRGRGPRLESRLPDFIATASEMKKLFQVSYCDREVSVLIHRVGGVLHLDGDFDVRGLNDIAAKPAADRNRVWSKAGGSGFAGSGAQKKENSSVSSQTPDAKNGFLCYSVAGDAPSDCSGFEGTLREIRASLKRESRRNRGTSHSRGSDPSDMKRVFQWQFNDVAMLLGSDSLIVSYPEQSNTRMQVRDIEEQISSAACLDLWLDNLMSGAQELALCYHKEGVLQGYQLVPTNEIPDLAQCRHLVAGCNESTSQLLGTIKEKCSEDGASYMLHKPEGSDEVKVYRLGHVVEARDDSHIDSTERSEKTQGRDPSGFNSASEGPMNADAPGEANLPGPFSYSVGVLCYRMALKILEAGDYRLQLQCQRLFQQCINSIEQSEHPQLWAAANMHLADLLLRVRAKENTSAGDEESAGDQHNGNSAIILLSKGNSAFVGSPQQYCLSMAADHLGRAVHCLTFYHRDCNSLSTMHRRAAELFAKFAEECCCYGMMGCAFRMVRFADWHVAAAVSIRGDSGSAWERHITRRLLCSSAEAHYSLAKALSVLDSKESTEHALYQHRQDLIGLSPNSVVAHNGEENGPYTGAITLVKDLSSEKEVNLNYAIQQYLGVLKLYKGQESPDSSYSRAVKALGEAYTQLGCIFKETGRFTKAHQHFTQGIPLFTSVGAQLCVATTYLELARLNLTRTRMLDLSSTQAIGEMQTMTAKTIDFYKSALAALGPRRAEPELWRIMKMELAETYVAAAGSLQVGLRWAHDPEKLGQVAADMFRGALKVYADVTSVCSDDRQPSESVDRKLPHLKSVWGLNHAAASIHHQTARLHGQLARLAQSTGHESQDVRRARFLALALSHIDKAAATFTPQRNPVAHIRLQLDAAALLRQLLPSRGVVKALETALLRLLGCVQVYEGRGSCESTEAGCACGLTAAEAAEEEGNSETGEPCTKCPAAMWRELEVEVNLVLRELIQARVTWPSARGNAERLDALKSMYRASLTQREHATPGELLGMLQAQF